MQMKPLGSTSLLVSALGFGGAPLSVQGRPERSQAEAAIRAALESGITFFDTANTYSLDEHDLGHNERLFLDAIPADRNCIIATKGGLARPGGDWTYSARPQALREACERSLTVLQREVHPLYYLHAPDPEVPFEESFGELTRLQAEGKIEHLGLSNVSAAQCGIALQMAGVAAVQNRFHFFDRRSMDVLDYCAAHHISFVAYSPNGGPGQAARLKEQPLLQELSRQYEASVHQIALAWMMALSPQLIPIPGATRPESVRDSAAAAQLTLAADDLAKLNACVASDAIQS